MGAYDGRTVLVTGGTSGIGLAVARRFVDEGAHVVLTGRRAEAVSSVAAEFGSSVTALRSDATRRDDLDRLAAEIQQRVHGLDVVCVNAGIGEFKRLEDVTWQYYRDLFDTNVAGVVFTVQAVLPLLTRGASIVIIGSNIDVKASPAFGLYAASKAAVRSLARTWSVELMERGVRVNVVAPGPTHTPGLEALAPDGGVDQLLETLAEGVPMQRLGRPSEVADAVMFLAGPQSTFITGTELYVDGGASQI